MSEPRELHCYEYVALPYERVRDAFHRDAAGLFRRATKAAAARAEELVATLRVSLGPIEVGADIDIRVNEVKEEVSVMGDSSTRVELSWTAARGAGLFPAMEATLSMYPLSSRETQLDLHGRYTPPLGAVGSALDSMAGYRLAEASVLRFVQDVAAQLQKEEG